MCAIAVTREARMEQKTIQILEQQRQDLVVRVLKKHEEMEASRFFTERILAGITEFFILLDKDFQIIQANREFLERTGYQIGRASCRERV